MNSLIDAGEWLLAMYDANDMFAYEMMNVELKTALNYIMYEFVEGKQ